MLENSKEWDWIFQILALIFTAIPVYFLFKTTKDKKIIIEEE